MLQLCRELLDRGLGTSGSIHVLRRRLTEHDLQSPKTPSGPYVNMTALELCSELLKRDLSTSGSDEEMRQRLIKHDALRSPRNPTEDLASFMPQGKYEHMKILELRRELKTRGLDMFGSLPVLMRRLTEHDDQSLRINDANQESPQIVLLPNDEEKQQSPKIALLPNDEEKQQSPTPIRLPILPTNVLVVQPNKIVFYVSCYNLNYKAASAPSSFCQIDIQQVRCYCRYSEYTTEVNIVNTPQKSCTDIYLRHLCNTEARRPMVFVGFVRTNCEEFKCVIAACFC